MVRASVISENFDNFHLNHYTPLHVNCSILLPFAEGDPCLTALFPCELLSSHVPLFAEESVASNHKIGSGIVDEAECSTTNTPTFFDTK